MSLSDATNKIVYAGDGTTVDFDITFPLLDNSDGSEVYGYVVDDEGNVTKLTSNYSVNVGTLHFHYPTTGGVSPLGAGVNAVPVGWELVVIREEPLSQDLTLTNTGILDLPSIEAAFDKLTMICQQLNEQLTRCFKAPINLPYTPSSPPLPPTAGVVLSSVGTLAELISLSNASPTVARFGTATDIGGGALLWYPGYASTNGIQASGWYAVGGGT